jgi:hypothetical protein
MDPLNPQQPNQQVPPSLNPQTDVRTMQSDINQVVKPAPASSVFDEKDPVFTPETNNQMSNLGVVVDKPKSSKALWIIIALVVIIGLAALGYYVVYPMLAPQPVTQTPVTPAEPATPETPVAPAGPVLATHTSAFVFEPAGKVPAQPTTLDLTSINGILKSVGDNAANETLTEVLMSDEKGQLAFAKYLTALLPSFPDAAQASTWMEDDFTAYVYKNNAGTWPGYIAKLKSGANLETLAQWVALLETNDLTSFYVSNPGKLAPFKNGTYKTISDRYATGSNGASFNYAIVNNYFVINTSFEGLKESLRLLGL